MLFPTHLAAAAVVGSLSRLSPGWVVVGAAVPDVVDKPLGMSGAVGLYHSLGHSLLLAAVAVPLALVGRAGLAAAVGWVSHLLLDAVHVVVNGRPDDAVFLAWPFALPETPLAVPPGSFFYYYLGTPSFYLEVAFWAALAVLLWRRRTA